MTTVAEAAPIADPVVRRKLRRRPPPSIRNGRALLLGVAGYGLIGLFTIGLGVIIGVKGALGLFIPFALDHRAAGRGPVRHHAADAEPPDLVMGDRGRRRAAAVGHRPST